MQKLAGIAAILGSQALAFEYNSKDKLLSLSISNLRKKKDIIFYPDVFPPLQSWAPNGTDYIPLYSDDDYTFGVNITIGEPPVSGILMIQNDSPDMFLWGENCTTCEDDDAFYNPANSSSFVASSAPAISLGLFDLTANVQQGYENVCLNGVKQTNATN